MLQVCVKISVRLNLLWGNSNPATRTFASLKPQQLPKGIGWGVNKCFSAALSSTSEHARSELSSRNLEQTIIYFLYFFIFGSSLFLSKVSPSEVAVLLDFQDQTAGIYASIATPTLKEKRFFARFFFFFSKQVDKLTDWERSKNQLTEQK